MKAMLDPNDSNADFREEDLEIVDTFKQRDLYQENQECNRQVQIINHIKVDGPDDGYVCFIIQNMFAMVEIQYCIMREHATSIRVF